MFDGTSAEPYREQDPTNPLNVYGSSKLGGERAIAAAGGAHLILRTSWIYGWHGQNFLLTMRRLAATRDELRVVADQFGVPNWSRSLAEATASLIGRGASALARKSGIYHLSGRGRASWFDFARAIFDDSDRPRVVPITTAEYPTPARRPASSVLATGKLEEAFGIALPHWRQTLAACKAVAG